MSTRAIRVCGVVVATMLVYNASAETIPVNSFRDMWGEPAAVKTVKSRYNERLMIDRGGVAESVGLDGTDWHIGFIDYRDGQTYVIGYAQNFKRVLAGYEGWMWGLYAYEMNYDEDLTPDDVFIVQDVLGDGIGALTDGEWVPGGDDVVYDANDVLFGPGQVRGDVSQLPAYGGSRYLPMMTISDVLAPITGDLNGDGFVGLDDLDIVLNAWNQSVPPGDPLADPTGDGFVGLADLDIVLNNWNAGTPPVESAGVPEPGAMALLLTCALSLLRMPRCQRA